MKKIFLLAFVILSAAVSFGQITDAQMTIDNNIKVRTKPANGAATANMIDEIIGGKLSVLSPNVSGTNTYSVTVTTLITSLTAGFTFDAYFVNANTGTSTLQVNSLTTKPLQKLVSGSAVDLSSGDLTIGLHKVFYNGSVFLIAVSSGGSSGLPSLAAGHIFVGNSSAVATDVPVSGDAVLSTAGSLSIANQAGNSGKYLTTNGSVTSWSTVAGGGGTPTGSNLNLQYNNAGAFGAIANGTTGQVLTTPTTGSLPVWSTPTGGGITALTGDVTASGTGSVVAKVVAGGTPIGDLYSENFSGGTLTNYTNTGSASAAISGGTLNISGGTLATTSNVITRNITQSFDYSYRRVQFKVTANVSGEAIGIGYQSVNSLSIPATVYVTFNTAASTNRGQVKIHSISSVAATDVTVATSSGALTYTNGDVIEMFISSTYTTTEVHVRNVTTPANAEVYVAYTTANTPTATPVGYLAVNSPAIFPLSGTFSIVLDAFGTPNKYNPVLVRIGDSITGGGFMGVIDQRDANIVASQVLGTVQVYAAGGNASADVLNSFSYVIQMKPKYVAIRIGINDIAHSVSLGTPTSAGTYLYNIQQIINQCFANGIVPILLYITPTSAGVGLSGTADTWNAALVTNFASQCLIIDDATQLKSSGTLASIYDAGDGLHIGVYGHVLMGTTQMTNYTFLNKTKIFGTNIPSSTLGASYYAGTFGALTPSLLLSGGAVPGITLATSSTATAGNTFGLIAYNQSTYKSVLKYADVASGNPSLSLTNDGGQVTFDAGLMKISDNGSNTVTLEVNPGATMITGLLNVSYQTALGGAGYNGYAGTTHTYGLGFDSQANYGGGTAGTLAGSEVYFYDYQNSAYRLGINSTGDFFIGASSSTFGAKITQAGIATFTKSVNIGAGTSIVAPLVLTSGTNLTTTQAGAIEFDGTHFYGTITNAGTRFQLDQQSTGSLTAGTNTIDANYTAVANTYIHAPAATLTASRTFTMPAGSAGNIIEFYNSEGGFAWTLAGASVYLADESVLTQFLGKANYVIRFVDGKWRISN